MEKLYMMSEIITNLYISDKHHVPVFHTDYDLIVNCTPDIPFPIIHKSIIRIPVYDDPSYAQKMLLIIKQKQVLETIHKHLWEGKTVLVHCHAGMQRSCAVVACYLVKYHDLTPDEAILYIKKRRPIAFMGNVNFKETIDKI
jgi:protein tyrosine/serine phosphatase